MQALLSFSYVQRSLFVKKKREKKKFMPELELEGLKGLLGFQLIEQADSPRYGRM